MNKLVQNLEYLKKEDVTFQFEGSVLYNGAQAMRLIGHINTSAALHRHVNKEERYLITNSKIVNGCLGTINNRGKIFITEKGFKQAVSSSKLPGAVEIANSLGIMIHKTRLEYDLYKLIGRFM